MKIKLFLTFLVLTAPVAADAVVFSAEVTDHYRVSVYLDTEGELVNAIEGRFTFPPDLLSLSEFRDGNSIVPLWVEKSDGRFSGVIPGGFRGERGLLFSIDFSPRGDGTASVSLDELQALRNDGAGTPLAVTSLPLQFSVSRDDAPAGHESTDTTPPEPFTITYATSSAVFNGDPFIVFLTADKGSGVAYYRVCEGVFAPCTVSASPHRLTRGGWQVVRVVAYDHAGNHRTAYRYPPMTPLFDASLAGAGILLVLGLWIFFARRRLGRYSRSRSRSR